MSRTIIVSLFLLALSTVTTAQDQIDPLAKQRALGRELKAAVEQRYPKAKVTSCDLDTTDEVECNLEVVDLAASDIISEISTPDTSNIARLALAFINSLNPLLRIDPATLVGVSKRDFPWRHEGVGLDLWMRQCFRGIPVERSSIDFRIEQRQTRLRIRGALKPGSLNLNAELASVNAMRLVEQYERNRYEDGRIPRQVWGFGITSSLKYDEYFEITDSTGEWIPYSDRVLGSELIIYSDSSTGRIEPILTWRIGYGLGERHFRDMYFVAYVDARSGSVIEMRSTGGGCIVDTWRALSCTNWSDSD